MMIRNKYFFVCCIALVGADGVTSVGSTGEAKHYRHQNVQNRLCEATGPKPRKFHLGISHYQTKNPHDVHRFLCSWSTENLSAPFSIKSHSSKLLYLSEKSFDNFAFGNNCFTFYPNIETLNFSLGSLPINILF